MSLEFGLPEGKVGQGVSKRFGSEYTYHICVNFVQGNGVRHGVDLVCERVQETCAITNWIGGDQYIESPLQIFYSLSLLPPGFLVVSSVPLSLNTDTLILMFQVLRYPISLRSLTGNTLPKLYARPSR